jgi:hypothetical protein
VLVVFDHARRIAAMVAEALPALERSRPSSSLTADSLASGLRCVYGCVIDKSAWRIEFLDRLRTRTTHREVCPEGVPEAVDPAVGEGGQLLSPVDQHPNSLLAQRLSALLAEDPAVGRAGPCSGLVLAQGGA